MAPGEWAQLTVSDVGMGIAPDDLPHVFEPFFTTQAPQHSGLGLPQVHGIVAQHGGHVTIDSLPDQGTTVTVYLPTSKSQPSADAPQQAANRPWPQGQGERILVVESNPTVAAAIAEALHSLNYRTAQADNGAAALQLLADATTQIDLILSDVMASESTGIELFHFIRRKHPALPVIFISGRPDHRQIEALKAAGLAAWLDKPPRLEQLAAALRAALDNRP